MGASAMSSSMQLPTSQANTRPSGFNNHSTCHACSLLSKPNRCISSYGSSRPAEPNHYLPTRALTQRPQWVPHQSSLSLTCLHQAPYKGTPSSTSHLIPRLNPTYRATAHRNKTLPSGSRRNWPKRIELLPTCPAHSVPGLYCSVLDTPRRSGLERSCPAQHNEPVLYWSVPALTSP